MPPVTPVPISFCMCVFLCVSVRSLLAARAIHSQTTLLGVRKYKIRALRAAAAHAHAREQSCCALETVSDRMLWSFRRGEMGA